MKTTLVRILTATLAATFVLFSLLSLSACGKVKYEQAPLSNSVADDPEAAVFAYVKENQKVLNEVVTFLSEQDGLPYYYFFDTEDKVSGVEQLVYEGDTYVRRAVENKTLRKLAKIRFTGEVSYVCDDGTDIYSFYTYMKNNEQTVYFVYCPDDDAVRYLSYDFLHGETEVTVSHITNGWYYVQAR